MFTRRQKILLVICAGMLIVFSIGFAVYMIGSIVMQRPIPDIVQGVFSPFYYWVEIVLGAFALLAAACFRNARKFRPVMVLLIVIGIVNLAAGACLLIFHPFDHVFEEFSHVQTIG